MLSDPPRVHRGTCLPAYTVNKVILKLSGLDSQTGISQKNPSPVLVTNMPESQGLGTGLASDLAAASSHLFTAVARGP